MILLRLAHYNTKRLLRHKGIKIAFITVPLTIALLRAVLAGNTPIHHIADLCPFICALMIAAVLYTQWSVDSATGLTAGLLTCSASSRRIVTSRILSGVTILAAQMICFGTILALRF